MEKDNPILYNENAIKEERFLSLLKEKPFWIENEYQHKKEDSKHGDLCCWNQIVGLPKKGNEGTEKAIFDYEMDILRLLEGGEEGENNERRKEREEGGGEGKEKLGEREKEGKEGKEERKKKKKKYIWIKKSTGLGISEFFLRYIAFICTRDNALQYKRIV